MAWVQCCTGISSLESSSPLSFQMSDKQKLISIRYDERVQKLAWVLCSVEVRLVNTDVYWIHQEYPQSLIRILNLTNTSLTIAYLVANAYIENLEDFLRLRGN
jgi:hypothetical protein